MPLLELVEKHILVLFAVQMFLCVVLVYKQIPPRNKHRIRSNDSAHDDIYVFHENLLPDGRMAPILEDPDKEGMVFLGPTESPRVAQMRVKLSTLNYAQVRADDPELVQLVRDFWVRWPSPLPYRLESPEKEDFSMGQSAVVDGLLGKKEGGFFVECGALDGEIRSNSLFFERRRNWTGLLIEAGPINYRQMTRRNRKAFLSPGCLGVHPYPAVVSFNRGRNHGRVINRDEAFEWLHKHGLALSQMESQCFPLYSYLLALNRTHVDYLSLDVEGVELDVLQTVPWDKVNITVVTVEFTHGPLGKEVLRHYMEGHGYRTVGEVTHPGNLANDFVFLKS